MTEEGRMTIHRYYLVDPCSQAGTGVFGAGVIASDRPTGMAKSPYGPT